MNFGLLRGYSKALRLNEYNVSPGLEMQVSVSNDLGKDGIWEVFQSTYFQGKGQTWGRSEISLLLGAVNLGSGVGGLISRYLSRPCS